VAIDESNFIRPRFDVEQASILAGALKSLFEWGPVHIPELFDKTEYRAVADLYYTLTKLLALRDARLTVARLRGD
jgi:hypothetical protein